MKKIPLTQGQFALVDDGDYAELIKYKWCAHKGSGDKSFYALRHAKNCDGDSSGTTISMHRIIANAQKGDYVDHINHDTLNNQRKNLRICTNSQNMMNRGVQANNTSGYKGVGWNKETSKWRSKICVDGKEMHLGYFICKHEAARAYNLAARMYHGYKFAYTNIINEEA